MAIDVKPILHAGVAAQALALAGHSYSLIKKKKKKASDFLGVAGTTIVGSSLLQSQADFIGGL